MRRTTIVIPFVAVFLAACPSLAFADEVPLITPGHERLHPERLQPSRVSFGQMIGKGDEANIAGYIINTIDRFPHDEVESIVITQLFMNATATSTNELRVHGKTLAPMWGDEASLVTNGRIVTYYEPDVLHVVVADPGVEATQREDKLAHPSFDILQVPYVLASMDLVENEEFVFSISDPRSGNSFYMRLRVEGKVRIRDEESTEYRATSVRWNAIGKLEMASSEEYDWARSPVNRTYRVSSHAPYWVGSMNIPQGDNPRPQMEFRMKDVDVAPKVNAQAGVLELMMQEK